MGSLSAALKLRPASRMGKPPGSLAGCRLVMAGVFVLALTFSVALFAVLLTVGVVVWGYLWWKTRAVRKAMREQMDAAGGRGPGAGGAARNQGLIIEGEVIREVRVEDEDAPRRRD